jgi:hypothetical protein
MFQAAENPIYPSCRNDVAHVYYLYCLNVNMVIEQQWILET